MSTTPSAPGALADGSGRPSARSRARPLTVRCARYSGASDGALGIRRARGLDADGSARLTKVSGISELGGRTHNVTPVSYRTRAQARVRLAPTGVRYACGSDARGVYRTALLFDRSRGRPLIGMAEHDQRNRHGRSAPLTRKKKNKQQNE
jgi:hypothetical protein